MSEYTRILSVALSKSKSCFLWGPRKVGKTFWLHQNFPDAIFIDFLKTDVFADYISRPSLLRERYQNTDKIIVIDEVQLVPDLLNEVHWLIENKGISFILTGSSPRKLRRKHANMLGGRAWRYTMTPLCFAELPEVNLTKIINAGLIPDHLESPNYKQELRSYVADYLKEEIVAEAEVQNIPAFAEFLRVAALTNGELINYTNMARETGVSAKVIRSYFQILEDTLLGFRLQPWRKSNNRKLVETEKFYLFDVGISNYLANRQPQAGTPEFGKSFEHYILMELRAYQAYKNPELRMYFWRTHTGLEVDIILNDMEVAIEIKSSKRIHETDVKALVTLAHETNVKRLILISDEDEPKTLYDKVECLPWRQFLSLLWEGKIIS